MSESLSKQRDCIETARYVEQAKSKMEPGRTYTIEDLLDIDNTTARQVLAIMMALDYHPLIRTELEVGQLPTYQL